MEVEDLFTDLGDGKKLLKLLEIISGERLGKPNNGRMRVHKIENVNKSLAFLHTKVRHKDASRPEVGEGLGGRKEAPRGGASRPEYIARPVLSFREFHRSDITVIQWRRQIRGLFSTGAGAFVSRNVDDIFRECADAHRGVDWDDHMGLV